MLLRSGFRVLAVAEGEAMAGRKARLKTESSEIDPSFQPAVDAFAKHPDVAAGKMMSSYGLKVNGRIFAMFGRKQFVTKLPKQRVDELVGQAVASASIPDTAG
jgi:hypothetical protein